MGRIGPAGNLQTAGTFQTCAAVFVPAHPAIRGMLDQRIFRQQKFLGKALLGEIREIIPILQADAHGIEPRLRLQRRKYLGNAFLCIFRQCEDPEDVPIHGRGKNLAVS
jgi:hypothetical protein